MRQDAIEQLKKTVQFAEALLEVHQVLDGKEWSADTAEEIARILNGVGLEIREPDIVEKWQISAVLAIDYHLDEEEIVDVTVLPSPTDFVPMEGLSVSSPDSDGINEALFRYLKRVTVDTDLGERFALNWEG